VRDAYHDELDGITRQLTEIIDIIGARMRRAGDALLSGDGGEADQVVRQGTRLDAMREAVDAAAFRLMAQQQPVATDLRALVAAVHITDELERMGALARHVAEITSRAPHLSSIGEAEPILRRAAEAAVQVTTLTTELLASRELALLEPIQAAETSADEARTDLIRMVTGKSWDQDIETAIELTQLARYYERYVDHAYTIAERVRFIVAGNAD